MTQTKLENVTKVLNVGISTPFKDYQILIELSCYTISRIQKRNPEITPWDFFTKVVYKDKDSYYNDYIERLSLICTYFLERHHLEEFTSCGCKSAIECIGKIKQILDTTLPF